MKYYLIAGERSGDLHGGNLIKALKRHSPEVVMRGFGGEEMQRNGMDLAVHYKAMAFMGVVQVLLNIRKISAWLKFAKEDIVRFNPDVVVLIDYGGFNLRVAKFLKQKGIRVFYYISPKVWAWNQGRAWKLKALVDRMFCILPFEKEFFKKYDWEVDYVGNPVLDAVKAFKRDTDFTSKNNLTESENIVALLPGSRTIELKRMIPLMAELAKANEQFQFVVAAVNTLPEKLYEPLRKLNNVSFVFESTYDLLGIAKAAIVTSGTATLETGLLNVPQIVVYKAGALEYAIGSRLVKVKFISLVNLIADAVVIKEFIQHEANFMNLNDELNRLMNNSAYRKRIFEDYHRVYKILDTGSASENTARLIIKYLKRASSPSPMERE